MRLRNPSDLDDDTSLAEGLQRLPAWLYRFSSLSGERLEWMRSLILDSKLYFASPKQFNDPFDSKIPARYDAPAIDIDRYWRRAARRMHPAVPMHQLKPIVKKLIAESKATKGRARLTKSLFDSLEQNGVLCLAKSVEHTLLWAHYGDGHRGIAVRFNTSKENLGQIRPRGLLPIEVKYQSELPDLNFYYGTTAEFVTTVLGTKSSVWAHEKEWRLVLPETQGVVSGPPALIDGIVLGMRVDPVVEQTVRGWIEKRPNPLELLRMTNAPGTFNLTVVPA